MVEAAKPPTPKTAAVIPVKNNFLSVMYCSIGKCPNTEPVTYCFVPQHDRIILRTFGALRLPLRCLRREKTADARGHTGGNAMPSQISGKAPPIERWEKPNPSPVIASET